MPDNKPTRWYPTTQQLADTTSLERSTRQILFLHYQLEDRMDALGEQSAPSGGGSASGGPTSTTLNGLPLQPMDVNTTVDGSAVVYDKANRRFILKAGGAGGGVTSLNALTGALTIAAGTGISVVAGGSTITITNTGAGTGTVTSVALTAPSEFSVAGSPIVGAGTLAITWANPVSVAHGGTGDTTLAIHGVLIGNGTGAVNVTGTGTSGQVLTSNGAGADPTFQTPAASPSFADAETPSGSLPGTSFTLAHSPSPAASLILEWNGQVLAPGGVDYTLAGAAITTVSTIGSGDTLLAWYRY